MANLIGHKTNGYGQGDIYGYSLFVGPTIKSEKILHTKSGGS